MSSMTDDDGSMTTGLSTNKPRLAKATLSFVPPKSSYSPDTASNTKIMPSPVRSHVTKISNHTFKVNSEVEHDLISQDSQSYRSIQSKHIIGDLPHFDKSPSIGLSGRKLTKRGIISCSPSEVCNNVLQVNRFDITKVRVPKELKREFNDSHDLLLPNDFIMSTTAILPSSNMREKLASSLSKISIHMEESYKTGSSHPLLRDIYSSRPDFKIQKNASRMVDEINSSVSAQSPSKVQLSQFIRRELDDSIHESHELSQFVLDDVSQLATEIETIPSMPPNRGKWLGWKLTTRRKKNELIAKLNNNRRISENAVIETMFPHSRRLDFIDDSIAESSQFDFEEHRNIKLPKEISSWKQREKEAIAKTVMLVEMFPVNSLIICLYIVDTEN